MFDLSLSESCFECVAFLGTSPFWHRFSFLWSLSHATSIQQQDGDSTSRYPTPAIGYSVWSSPVWFSSTIPFWALFQPSVQLPRPRRRSTPTTTTSSRRLSRPQGLQTMPCLQQSRTRMYPCTPRILLRRWTLHLVASDMGVSCLPETISHSPTQDHCGIPNCRQMHRPGFQHCELAAFREWAKHSHPNAWFTVWTSTPDIQGQTPLSLIPYSCLVECLRHQPFLTLAKHDQHDWRERIPAPLTYLYDQQSAVQPLEPNYYEQHRVERRRRERHDRATTPRPTRPDPTTPRTPTTPSRAYCPQTFLPTTAPNQPPLGPSFGRPGTPPRSTRATSSNFPAANPWTRQGPTTQPPMAPQPTTTSATAHAVLPEHHPRCVEPILGWWSTHATTRPTDFSQTQLGTSQLTKPRAYQLIHRLLYTTATQTILQRLYSLHYQLRQICSFCRLADAHQTPGRDLQPCPTSQMTWWGLLHRQSSLYSDQQTYTEQTLTIPLPTNTADPETSILTTFFYMFMNQERARAFQSTDRPIATTKRLLTEWIGLAGDFYRLSTRQLGSAQRITLTMATVILDIINANIPVEQRQFVPTDRNVTLDALTHKLRFYDPWRSRTERTITEGAKIAGYRL